MQRKPLGLLTAKVTKGSWANGVGFAGRLFLDWLSVPTKLRWLDVGCGTGAFTEIIQQSSDASEIIARASYTQLESMQSEAAPDMIASLAMS
jgi:16S rRNA G1207 methylase RsmC